jgi:hypothetical protein
MVYISESIYSPSVWCHCGKSLAALTEWEIQSVASHTDCSDQVVINQATVETVTEGISKED